MTELPVNQELWQMAQMILCGWVIMLSGHQKQAVSRIGRWNYRQRVIGDFLFCVSWAIGLWLILLQVSGGVVRNYILLGLAGGMAGYHWFFRRCMERFCRLQANAVVFVWRRVQWILWLPWQILFDRMLVPWRNGIRKILYKKQESAIAEENIIENENNFLS